MAKTIPAGWQEKTLGDILDKGASVLSANKLNNCQGEYPVYGARGLIAKVNFYQQDKEYLAIIKDGAGVGRVYHYEANSSVLGTLQYLFPKCEINIRFGYYYLQSIDFSKYYQGAAIPHIYYNDYKKEKIILPPLPEQERIVAKFDKAFEAIDKAKAITENNLKNAKELFESSLNKAFTENTNDWEEKTLGEVCVVERGSSPRPIKNFITNDGSGVNWIKIGDCSEKYVTSTAQKITGEGAKKSRYVKEGDFIISNSMSYGKPYILKIDGYIHDGWFVLKLNKNLVNTDYFYYLLSSNYIKEQYDALATGAIVQNISSDLIKKVQFKLPSLLEQERIVARLDKLHEQIKQLEAVYSQKIKNFDELKQSILKRAFRGEL